MGTTLVVNPGSSSRKYALYRGDKIALEIALENTKNGFEMCHQTTGEQQFCKSITAKDFKNSFSLITEEVEKYLFKENLGKLNFVAIRVVAPGTYFQKHTEITDEYVKKMKEREISTPLHIPIILREIKNARESFKQAKVIAVSDSAFFAEMPAKAREYSITSEDSKKLDIYRFGYHGLSVASITRRIHSIIGIEPEKMVVCHVGNGTSVSAVKNGVGVDTTMGFSPSSGLPMGSRAGDLDAPALLELMRVKNWKPTDAELYINTRCGLAGLGNDSDIRTLLDRKSQNDAAAVHALEVFSYKIQQAVAKMTVALGGMDVLVLTATASVRSFELRKIILSGLEHLGVNLNEDRNNLLVGKDGVISVRNSPVKVVVMKTDEMGEMAYIARNFT